MKGLMASFEHHHRGIIKQAFLIGAARSVAAPVLKTMLSHPVASASAALTGSELLSAGRAAAQNSAGRRTMYQNLAQLPSAGPTF